MALVKWEPLREIEEMFDRYSKAMGWPRANIGQELVAGDWLPKVDIAETDQAFEIKVELPEVNREDIKISMESGVLSIRGERKQEKEEKGKKFHRIERHYGSFVRSFSLPENVDPDKVKATFKDGMLNLHLEKSQKSTPKAIDVKVE